MEKMFDVIIVGAGPGGATAAFELSRGGLDVLVLEKDKIPRYKTCGGGVSPSMLNRYFPFSIEPVIENHILTLTYTYKKSCVTAALPAGVVCTVMRDKFDALLLSKSTAIIYPGVQVKHINEVEDFVSVETNTGIYQGHFLIGADGANSIVARDIGLRKKKLVAGALEAEVPVDQEIAYSYSNTMHFIFGEIQKGYAWIFPKRDSLSVGVAGYRPKPGELQEVLRKIFSRFHLPFEKAKIHGHPIPIYSRKERIATDRILLVGDSAGLVDPLSGEGIRLAIKSGKLAANAILSGKPKLYEAMVHKEIGIYHQWGLGLAYLFYTFPFLCFWLGAANPLSTHAFGDLLSDKAKYPEVILRIFGSLPIFLSIELISTITRSIRGPIVSQNFREGAYSIFK